ncbi:MAG TPA: glycosyltransferase [Acidobacteriaceae bacterium]|jgi:glycosyltransferase involved in cell wall biosynthesis|nr:glycosyltransferase [Acidobacteriaceae bacterium]
MTPGLRLLRDLAAAGIALAWLQRAISLLIHLPGIPDVRDALYDKQPAASLTVIVPARDEAAHIEATLRSLLAQEMQALQIVAVNDRSVDETGAIMERLAAENPERLHVLHITELPAGWVGKPHAMAMAAAQAETDWLLFTDADVVFAPDVLRRAVVCAEKTKSGHLVVAPTMVMNRWDEGIVLGFFQAASLWSARPWKIPDAKAKRDSIGVGAFNMVRREAYEAVGGFTALRMEVLEDVYLGIRLKRAGYTQRMVFGPGMVRVHWASGVNGLLRVMTKNMFSLFRFKPWLLLLGCAAMFVGFVLPFSWIFIGGMGAGSALRYAGVITAAAIVLIYRAYGRISGFSAWYAPLFPVGALLMIVALLRSMVMTWRQGGVLWRGTLYTLEELRKNAGEFK